MGTPEDDTWSLDSSAGRTVEAYGRLYNENALAKRISFTPVDDEQREMWAKQHEVYKLVFDGRLIFPPIQNPTEILDCGYGSAEWCIEVAEKYPECRVIGVDFTPNLTPDEIPPNLWLQLDDLNEPFTFSRDQFDFIHSRNIVTGINRERWPSFLEDCLRVLKPGGWFQSIEMYYNIQSDNGKITEDHAIRKLSLAFLKALEEKDMHAPISLHSMMQAAGFGEIESKMIAMPLNGWPKDPKEREIGEKNFKYHTSVLRGHTQMVLKGLGMPMDEIQDLIARACTDLEDISAKPYFGLYVSLGRKPNS